VGGLRSGVSDEIPEHPLTEEELSLRRAAECAGIEGYYDSHYRLYCRFTHAAFRASTGDLSEFDLSLRIIAQ
jgi:hypothetical protein